MDELRQHLQKGPDLSKLGERLSALFSHADLESLLSALEKGDMALVSKYLGASEEELDRLFKSFKTAAAKLAKEYPDLSNFARSMRTTGSL